jgi:predicted MPP superfamily phosphohydrolase
MKILLTADLHCNSEWFRWVEEHASEYELISIAGDLLDIFSKVAIEDQLVLVMEFLRRLAQKTSVAVCSGNHDQVEILPPLVAGAKPCYSASWLEEISDVPNLVSDGQTRLVGEQLIVSTIPFSSAIEREHAVIDEGKRLRAEHTAPWLRLIHEPARAQTLISKARPDFVHFGHYHGPSGFSRRSGTTLFLCAGQRLGAAIPNHIVLDLETSIAVWKCKG